MPAILSNQNIPEPDYDVTPLSAPSSDSARGKLARPNHPGFDAAARLEYRRCDRLASGSGSKPLAYLFGHVASAQHQG